MGGTDPDDDLVSVRDMVNTAQVAELLGLSQRESVSTYLRRYPDFPKPVFVAGTTRIWRRSAVQAWAASRKRPGGD